MIRRLLTFAVFAATVASPWKASALTQCQRCIEIMAPDTFECAAVCGGVFQLQLNYINMLRTLSPVQPAWLQRVNQYRGLARLASVSENTSLDPDEVAYAQHMVTTDTVAHDTSPAGQNSDLAGTSSPTATDQSFVDMWMSGPFHALGIIDPRLVTTAYGSAHDNVGAVQSAGALDVGRGRTGSLAGITFPVIYPANGTTLPINSFTGGESPNPLTGCSFSATPAGPPLIVQLATAPSTAAGRPTGTLSCGTITFQDRDGSLCIHDETSYPVGSTERNIFASRHAVVLMARSPLPRGATCVVSLTTNGTRLSWSFIVG